MAQNHEEPLTHLDEARKYCDRYRVVLVVLMLFAFLAVALLTKLGISASF